MQPLNYRHFKIATALTALSAILLLCGSFIMGKNDFFLFLNNNFGKTADLFFTFWTNMGDGIWWIPVLVLFILFRKKSLPLLLGSFIFSELFIQLFKSLLFPDQPRPTKAITDLSLIHTVQGVELLKISSFPSGHTTEIFIFFLLASLLVNNKWIIPIGFVYALLVAYSRIYLAEHFPLDIAGGMIGALISVGLALLIQVKLFKNTTPK
jgi:membrane-associated phospholipid phosphatase